MQVFKDGELKGSIGLELERSNGLVGSRGIRLPPPENELGQGEKPSEQHDEGKGAAAKGSLSVNSDVTAMFPVGEGYVALHLLAVHSPTETETSRLSREGRGRRRETFGASDCKRHAFDVEHSDVGVLKKLKIAG